MSDDIENATPERRCDMSGMAVIHRMFRAGFGEGGALVDGVADGDAGHAAAVAGHLAEISSALRSHHEGEDELVWDRLTERAPACALHVERMRAQHAAMLVQLGALERALPAWRTSGARSDAVAVVTALDAVNASLTAHLPDEEASIVPVMEQALSEHEARELAAHGRRSAPKGSTWRILGAILVAQPDGGAQFLHVDLPAPVRLLWRAVGRRNYERHRTALARGA